MPDSSDAARPSPPPSSLLEGRYLALDPIGLGEMSDVYRGTDTWSGELVAIRILRADRPQHEVKFRRTAERLFGLPSSRFVRAIHLGDDRENRPFLVTELLIGRGVQTIGRVRWEVACEIARHGALALSEMHLHELFHGELHPASLFVGSGAEGGTRVKLLDLGSADRTATAAKDRRALARILHRLLTGADAALASRVSSTETSPIRLASLPDAPPELEEHLQEWLEGDKEIPLLTIAHVLRAMLDPEGEQGLDRPSAPMPALLVFPKHSVMVGGGDD